MEKLRTVIVGFGFMGRTHAGNILSSNTMTLVAVVDSRPDALQQSTGGNIATGGVDAETMRSVRLYGSLDDCLANETVDLVYVCVHTLAHFETAMKALKHGAHVFVEKPFVLNPDEGEALITEARRQGLHLGVAHVVRFMPAYVSLREMVENQEYGALRFLSLTRFTGLPDWGDWSRRRTDRSSGGALFDLVIHDIDFMRFLLGEPDELTSTCIPGALSDYDYVCAFWRYRNRDLQAKIEGGNIFPSRLPFEASYKAVFDKATVVWNSGNAMELKVINDAEVETIPLSDPNDGYRDEGLYFADCIINNRFPEYCSAESSLQTIRLCIRHSKE